MFKKPLQLHSRTTLKSSATRSIKEQIQQTFPTITDEDIYTLFPSKEAITQDKVTTSKDSNALKISIYYIDKARPLFFDISGGRGAADLYPSIYTLWLIPHIVPAVYIPPPVSSYLLQGADLMLPGVLQPAGGYGTMNIGDKRCVIARGNPAALAVGNLLVDDKHIKTKGWIGRGMKICHHYGDSLWASGDKSIPNTGFQTQEIQAIITMEELSQSLDAAITAEGPGGERAPELQKLKHQLEEKKKLAQESKEEENRQKQEKQEDEENIQSTTPREQENPMPTGNNDNVHITVSDDSIAATSQESSDYKDPREGTDAGSTHEQGTEGTTKEVPQT